MFRKILTFIAIAGITIGLSGCSSRGGNEDVGSYTLYLWRPLDVANEEVFKELINNFQDEYPNIKIELVSKHPDKYEDEMLSALAAHQTVANAPDIILLGADKLPNYIPQLAGAPTDLFSRFSQRASDSQESAIDTVRQNYIPMIGQSTILNDASGQPKLYGLPLSSDNLALYINTAIIEEATESINTDSRYTKDKSREEIKTLANKVSTPPATWTELTEIVPYLTVRDGNNITRSAIAMGTSTNVERSYDILSTIMMQNGTQMTSSQFNQATFNLSRAGAVTEASPGEEALKFYLRFSNPNDPLYTWNGQMSNSVDAFMQGQVAMMIHYASTYVQMINEYPTIKRNIEIAPLPQITASESATSDGQVVLGSANLLSATSAKGDPSRQLASWNFIRFATTRIGASPYLSAVKLPSALIELEGKSKFDAFESQRNIARMWFKGHQPMKVDQIFISMIDDAYNGRKSIKEAVDSASADATTILQSTNNKWVGQ